MKHITFTALLATSLLAAGSASASTLLLPGAEGVSATWDFFPSANFTGDAPDTASSTFDATFSYSASPNPGSAPSGGDRLYSGSGPTGNAPQFQIAGSATSALGDISLVLKFTTPNVATPETYYTITLNGVSTVPVSLGFSDEGGQNAFNVYQWTWSGLALNAGDTFTIAGSGPAAHVSMDAVQVSSIPEASTSILGALAAGAFLVRRRRH